MVPDVATVKKLYAGTLSTSATAKYTTPSATTKAMVVSIILHNTAGAARVVEIWLVPNGGSATNANRMFKISIDADGTEAIKEQIYMTELDSLYFKEDTGTDVVVFVNGVEVVPQS